MTDFSRPPEEDRRIETWFWIALLVIIFTLTI